MRRVHSAMASTMPCGGAEGLQQVEDLVLELDPCFLHVFKREVGDRHVVFLEVFDLAGEAVVAPEQAADVAARSLQGIYGVAHIGEFGVEIVVIDVHGFLP